MGNAFGYVPENGINHFLHPEIYPGPLEEPTHDPLLGFEGGRKKRECLATDEEMRSAKLPLNARDYCAHLALKYKACYRYKFPLVYRCSHEKHEYLNCQYDDFVLRMKEFEREKRLRKRALAA